MTSSDPRRHEILTVEQMYQADRAAAAGGIDSYALMKAAGEAVARALSSRWSKRPVAVLCGPGLNGGDGYVAAKVLEAEGWPVLVLALAPPAPATDAARAHADWGGKALPLSDGLRDSELVIDALFGAGLSRPLPAEAEAVLKAAEARHLPIVAVDLPSGLPGDAPEPLGYAPHAALTVTFHRKKPAHILEPASGFCGEVIFADIGIAAAASPRATLWENHPDLWLLAYPWPRPGTHKYARGALGVVGGGRFETGAARLAVRAGQRIAGAVRLFCDPAAADIYAGALEAAMLKSVRSVEEFETAAREMDAFVIGPAAGVNDTTRQRVEALSRTDAALCLDADALPVFKGDPEALFALVDERDVLTPHPGEFERLWPGLLKSSPTRIEAAREAARQAGCVVLLKGGDTVIAAPDGRAVVNTHATPWLATAGSGDVLAGVIGGLLAGRVSAFEAACCGAWMHGDAGRRYGPGLTAEDLPPLLPSVLSGLATTSAA
jgi:hydroxyethylthiazole kinase-like uncharacterized protein yjeF